MTKFRLSEETRRKAMEAARPKMVERRDRIAARAKSIASTEAPGAKVETSGGTRPRGRPFERVTMPANQEFGTLMEPRRRILGRSRNG